MARLTAKIDQVISVNAEFGNSGLLAKVDQVISLAAKTDIKVSLLAEFGIGFTALVVWLLSTGTWNDSGIWSDTAIWNDGA